MSPFEQQLFAPSPPSRTLAAKKQTTKTTAARGSATAVQPKASTAKASATKKSASKKAGSKTKKSSKSSATKKSQTAASQQDDDEEVIEVQGTVVEDDEDSSPDSEDDYDSSDDEDVDEDAEDPYAQAAQFEDADDDLDDVEGTSGKSVSRALAKAETSLASRDPLAAYMREVQAHPLLTPDEEKRLAIAYTENQDVAAAARLVTANLRLVVKLAYEYRRAYRNMMDLIQEGNMGLMQAVKKYDPYRGVKLSSYAAWWIRAYMLRYILANWRMVKLGTTQAQRKLFFNLNKEKARLTAMGIEPSNEAIANRLDVTENEVEEMDRRMSRSDASLDTPVNESDGRQIARVEMMPSAGDQPDIVTESAELGQLLRTHLTEFRKGLAGKDLIIFDQRLVADEPRTLQDLGDEFGVSRERVRQLEARMTGKLRDYLSTRIGDPISFS